MGDGVPWKIAHGPKSESHQADEEKGGEGHNAIDHLPLGNQMHEKARHQERLATCDQKSNTDIHRTMLEWNVRGPNRDHRSDKECHKYQQVPTDMMHEVSR